MPISKFRALLIPWAVWLATPLGCALRTPQPIGRDASIDRPRRFVLVFLVDGLSRDVLDRMVARGELPDIQQRFVQGGVAVDHAVASLPPITYPNTVSILTGRFPGHHGVLGNQWFDRESLRLQDYRTANSYTDVNHDFNVPTIYEILHDEFTVSMQNHTRRGATTRMDSRVASGIDWCLHRFTSVDRRVGARFGRVIKIAGRERRWPVLMTLYFPGLDEIGHRFGPDSPQYAESLRVIDKTIGSVFARLEAEEVADSAYYVLVSDHGLVAHPAHRTVDVADWLGNRLGWRIWHDRTLSNKRRIRLTQLGRYDAVVINGAFRRLSIHVRGENGWTDPPDDEKIRILLPTILTDHGRSREGPEPRASARAEVPEQGGCVIARPKGLLALPGVDLICVPLDPHRVCIYSRRGTAIVERRHQAREAQYRLVGPNGAIASSSDQVGDPLGYLATPGLADFVHAGWHTSRAWLSATANTAYPDFVPQIVEMFDSPRAGDVVVFAAEDWSFANVRGGHGSGLARDMLVPLYFSGPDLPPGGRVESARTVDVMPTILGLIDRHDRLSQTEPIDGINMAPALRNALPSRSAGFNPRGSPKLREAPFLREVAQAESWHSGTCVDPPGRGGGTASDQGSVANAAVVH